MYGIIQIMNKIVTLIIVFAIVSINIYANGEKEPVSVEFKGTIEFLSGEVLLNGAKAESGDKVLTNDIVETGKNSLCDIVFNRSNIIRMEEETILEINWAKSNINLKKGSISSIFENISAFLTQNNNFQILTPSVTAGIRGTSFYIKVEDELNTYICACNGSLELSSNNNENFISKSNHHKAFRFTKSGDNVEIESALLLYHNDSSMNAVAKNIGFTIDWESPLKY